LAEVETFLDVALMYAVIIGLALLALTIIVSRLAMG